jgi:hypothetical protein
MQLISAIHPVTRAVYQFPKAQAHLTAPNVRKNPVFIVPGGGGPINPKGTAPFDRDMNIITYQFRVFPHQSGQTFTQARAAFLQAIDHGLPQVLEFRDDDGSIWQMRAALTADPLDFGTQSDLYADYQVSWVALADLWFSNAAPGAIIYGHTVKYGHNAKYGASYPSYALTTSSVTVALDNSATGATATTTDAVVSITGPWGAAAPSAANAITVSCLESGTSFSLPINLLAGETLLVDLASRRVLKNGQPIFGLLTRPALQRTYLDLLPNTVNHVTVAFTGTPLTTLNGSVQLKWKPKRGA